MRRLLIALVLGGLLLLATAVPAFAFHDGDNTDQTCPELPCEPAGAVCAGSRGAGRLCGRRGAGRVCGRRAAGASVWTPRLTSFSLSGVVNVQAGVALQP